MKKDGNFWSSAGPLVIREIGIAHSDNFDRMTDDYRIFIRHAPDTSGHYYEKDVVYFSVPSGTPTPGLDVLAWLLHIVEEKERKARTLRPSSVVECVKDEK